MTGWGDEDPEEMQAHFEFAGPDDWEIERFEDQWQEEEEEEKVIDLGHREGCRHGKLSQDTVDRIETLYLEFPLNNHTWTAGDLESAIGYVVDTLDEPLCGLMVAKTLAAAGHIPPFDLEEEEEEASSLERIWGQGHDSETSGSKTGEFWSRADDEIVLYFWKGKSTEEIATKLQRTARAVRARVYFLSVEMKEIDLGHREGCRHGKLSQDTVDRIETLYLEFPLNNHTWTAGDLESAIGYVVDTLDEPLCGLMVAKTLAAAGHIPPVDLEHVIYYSPQAGQGNYKRGRWTVQEVARLKDAFNKRIPLEQILEVVDRSPLAIIWQLTSLGLLTNEDLASILTDKYESTASEPWPGF